MKASTAGKLAIVAIAIGVMAWLFLKTAQNANARPYTIAAGELPGWRIVAGDESSPVLLGLQPSGQMRQAIYNQIFHRAMVSLTMPEVPMPLVLRPEYSMGLEMSLSRDDLMNLARRSGLETARFDPVCLGQEQLSSGRSQQVYYAVFKAPAFERFRRELAQRQSAAGGRAFDPNALRPILAIAASDVDFGRTPLDASAADRCLAPLVIED